MQNRYDKKQAQKFIKKYSDCPADLSLRVYTSRIIGAEEELVLHGGGNTSAKSTVKTLLGEELEVLFIKGSGWDLGDIEPQGFPALDLNYLCKLKKLDSLTDEEMVNQFRTHMLDASSPNPSIETLVHAFLPHKFIDHTHADAIVTLTNLDDPEAVLKEALGDNIAILPFIMPGFPLAKAMAELYESNPESDCIILRNHGIFTFGDDAETAYERMIHYVTKAEGYLAQKKEQVKPVEMDQVTPPDGSIILPALRGALNRHVKEGKAAFFLHVRHSNEIVDALARPDAKEVFVSGVLTPDHVIRTKNYPVFFDFSGCDEKQITKKIKTAFKDYKKLYADYFKTQVKAKKLKRTMLDPLPRVMLIKGVGIVTAGTTPKAARIAADIAEHTVLAKVQGAAVGPYCELDEASIFDMEYWSLEQAKLGKSKPLPLQGKSALVTGGGGAIALGIGRQLLNAGARVFLTDVDKDRQQKVVDILADRFGDMVSSLSMDVTNATSVKAALEEVVAECGGLDIIVPNAGVAHVAKLDELTEEKFRQVIDVNLMGVFQVIKSAVPILRRQQTGGHVIINSSKNVFDPGAAFGAYSASKAGAHQIGKIAALELAELGVRVNMINADAIFDANGIPSGLWDVVGPDRMKARKLDPAGLKEYYRNRNLLKTEVLADHVGNAVVFFASGLTPTTGATLPVDGGIPAAFPR